MAKLIHMNPITGEVATIAGFIQFDKGIAEVSNEVAAQIQVSDIRVELGDEPQKEEPKEEKEAEQAEEKEVKEAAPVKAPTKKAPAKK